MYKQLIGDATAILDTYVFFEQGEAGSAHTMYKILVDQSSINLAIAFRKGESRVAHTLTYPRNINFDNSLVDLVLKYGHIRRSLDSRSDCH